MLYHHTKTKKKDKFSEEDMSLDGHNNIVEVQFCANCYNHNPINRHNENKYLHYYEQLKKGLTNKAVMVRRKHPPNNIYKKSPYSPSNHYLTVGSHQLSYFPRVGSFQIYFNNNLIFSKLQSGTWPNINKIIIEIYKKTLQVKRFHKLKQNNHAKTITIIQNDKMKTKSIDIKCNPLLYKAYEKSKANYERLKARSIQLQINCMSNLDQQVIIRPNSMHVARRSHHHQRISQSKEENRYHHNNRQSQLIKFDENVNESDKNIQQLQVYSQKANYYGQIKKNSAKNKKSCKNSCEDYLQPVFPKSSLNLQNINRRKSQLASKINQLKLSKQKQDILQFQIEKVQKNQQLILQNISEQTDFKEQTLRKSNLQSIQTYTLRGGNPTSRQQSKSIQQYKIQCISNQQDKLRQTDQPIAKKQDNIQKASYTFRLPQVQISKQFEQLYKKQFESLEQIPKKQAFYGDLQQYYDDQFSN